MNARARIFIVEDHPIVREHLAILINRESDLITCGEADDAPAAFQAITTCRPDLVTVDLTLKNSSGFELIKDLRAWDPALRMLVVTMYDDVATAARVMRAGAQGILIKSDATDNLPIAIRRVLAGQTYFTPPLAEEIAQYLLQTGNGTGNIADQLSDREWDVAELLTRGWETDRIAGHLRLSDSTVHTYCERLKLKLGVQTQRELLVAAARVVWETTAKSTGR